MILIEHDHTNIEAEDLADRVRLLQEAKHFILSVEREGGRLRDRLPGKATTYHINTVTAEDR